MIQGTRGWCTGVTQRDGMGREERKLTGDSAIPVIPDEIAARALACQD